MTTIHLYRGRQGRLKGFSVIGHAGGGPYGEDIVCAGVSVLAQTAVNALEAIASIVTAPRIGDGFLSLRLPKRLSPRQMDSAQIILRTAAQGFEDIAMAYPQFVRIC